MDIHVSSAATGLKLNKIERPSNARRRINSRLILGRCQAVVASNSRRSQTFNYFPFGNGCLFQNSLKYDHHIRNSNMRFLHIPPKSNCCIFCTTCRPLGEKYTGRDVRFACRVASFCSIRRCFTVYPRLSNPTICVSDDKLRETTPSCFDPYFARANLICSAGQPR
jgi:hypothetical protein